MLDFINYLKSFFDTIWNFVTFLLSIPSLLLEWINAFPPFLRTGFYSLIILVTTILAIKIVTMIKEMIL